MNLNDEMKIPQKAQAEAWLRKWGQALYSGRVDKVNGRYIPRQVRNGNEVPAAIAIIRQNSGMHYFYNQAAIKNNWADDPELSFNPKTFYENLTVIEYFISSLRILRDEPNIMGDEEYNYLKDAFSYFSHQYSALPQNSKARDILTQAWNEYYSMLYPKNWQHDIFGYKIPELEIIPDVEVPGNWIREYSETEGLTLDEESIEVVEEMLILLGKSIKLQITNVFIEDNDEIILTLSQSHITNNRTENQLLAFISALCYSLETEYLTNAIYYEEDGTVKFTLDATPNQFLNFDLLRAANIANGILTKKIEPVGISINSEELKKNQLTQAEKVVSAAFIGVGLGSPQKIAINYENNCVIIYTGERPFNSKPISYELEDKKIDTAIAALSACTELLFELDDEMDSLPIIKLVINGNGRVSALDTANHGAVIKKAMRLDRNENKRKDGPDQSPPSDEKGMDGRF